MAKTYLDIVNHVLREGNEVPLTTGNFTSARGIQEYVKEAVNRALMDVANASQQWEWLKVGTVSVPNTVTTADGTQWYSFKTIGAGDTYFPEVDFDTFFIDDGADLKRKLYRVDYDTWHKRLREQDEGGADGVPLYIIETDEKNSFGLSPVPDGVYTVHFVSWKHESLLVNSSDTIPFPDQYYPTLVSRALYYYWRFKDDQPQASRAEKDYERGVNSMKDRLSANEPVRMRSV